MKLIAAVVFLITIVVYSNKLLADSEDTFKVESDGRHSAWPLIAGAGLVAWWVYEESSSPEEGRKNVRTFLTRGILVVGGLVLYQQSKDKGLQVVSGALNETAYISVNYRYK